MNKNIWLVTLLFLGVQSSYATQVKPRDVKESQTIAVSSGQQVSGANDGQSAEIAEAASFYQRGKDHAKEGDHIGAHDLMVRAYKLGSTKAAYWLGCEYEAKKDYKHRDECWHYAAQGNHPEALFKIGLMYYKGVAPYKPDEKSAYAYFEKAANVGCKRAIETLCSMALEHKNSQASDYIQQKLEHGKFEAYINFCLGMLYYEHGDVTKACKHLNAAIENGCKEAWDFLDGKARCKGNICAQYIAGMLQYKGVHQIVPKDEKMALVYMETAAKHGYKLAIDKLFDLADQNSNVLGCLKKWIISTNDLGILYRLALYCKDVQHDIPSACYYFFRAAAQGHATSMQALEKLAEAQCEVARSYVEQLYQEQGKRIVLTRDELCMAGCMSIELAKDYNDKEAQKAFGYFLTAANAYSADGAYYLALCYQHGFGVKQNLRKAAEYFEAAKDGGCRLTTTAKELFGPVRRSVPVLADNAPTLLEVRASAQALAKTGQKS